MPLARIDLVQGKSADYRKAIGEVIYDAMIKTINVPKDDRFQVITEHPAEGLIFDPTYLGIQRTADCIFIQVTLNEGRTVDMKRAFYKAIADGLHDRPDQQVPHPDRPAEAHHPQRHDPAPHVLVHPSLQRRVQRRDEREVEGPRDGDAHIGRDRTALQRKGTERDRIAHQADAHEQRLRRPGEDRPDGDGADEGAGAEGGVQDAVVGGLREVDAEVVRGHHRHLSDEGQSQQ